MNEKPKRAPWTAKRWEKHGRKMTSLLLPNEVWREVPGVPGMMASSSGRARFNNGKPRYGSWQKSSGQGRFIITVGKSPNAKNHMIARLVCMAFHGLPPDGKPNVLHDDEDARNNQPGNLHWGTQKENLNYPGFISYCEARTGDNNPNVKGKKKRGILLPSRNLSVPVL
jgi:hypothetical protein